MENNKNKKSVKFQGDMLNFCDFIQVFVFTTNHHLNVTFYVHTFDAYDMRESFQAMIQISYLRNFCRHKSNIHEVCKEAIVLYGQ